MRIQLPTRLLERTSRSSSIVLPRPLRLPVSPSMAWLLSARTVAGASPSLTTAARPFSLRRLSGRPDEKVDLVQPEIEAEDPSSEIEVFGMLRLEEAIHTMIVRRSAPDWLPFIPGSSYWVPRRGRPPGVVELVSKFTNPMTVDEILSFTSDPVLSPSAYFVEGTAPQPMRKIKGRTKVFSDDEKS
ncbi:unnamed protein product [Musa acuminata subsp. burmannicoides]